VPVAPVDAEPPGARQFGVGDSDRVASFNRWLHRLSTDAFGVAVGTGTRHPQRPEFETGPHAVFEEHLDVRLAVYFDRFDVMLGHVASVPNQAPPRPLTAERCDPLGTAWLRNRWDDLTFVHWAYPPGQVQALLPDGLRVDTFDRGDGNGPMAWVSLVPFRMRRAGPTVLPAFPWLSTFAETNVRTYVVDSAGNRAVWFLSLDATRLPVVAFARWTIGFPYVWADMTIEQSGQRWTYTTTQRRWPRRPAARTRLVVDVGEQIEPTELDVFLTARWGTVARWRGQLRHHPVEHPPWTLHDATIIELSDSTVAASGLPAPTGDPVVRWAEPFDAHFGRPTRV
jgi:uncharacterized protein YqjF (DUF2071 family)